jgi:hypothetical protein
VRLRDAARELLDITHGVRRVSSRVLLGGDEPERFAIARDLDATAATLARYAAIAERAGIEAGEPDPDATLTIEQLLGCGVQSAVLAGPDPRSGWPVDHEYGE